jgi:hypothetical protein
LDGERLQSLSQTCWITGPYNLALGIRHSSQERTVRVALEPYRRLLSSAFIDCCAEPTAFAFLKKSSRMHRRPLFSSIGF